jgi:hypothetical protein
MWGGFMLFRNPSVDELRLLEFLIQKAEGLVVETDWQQNLRVSDMEDGGMGSLRLFPKGSDVKERAYGCQASDCQFIDDDGVKVIASLNLDKDGNLFEVDIWKTDFGKLIHIPTGFY